LRYFASALYYLSGPAAIIFLISPVLICITINYEKLFILYHNPAILTLPLRIIFYSLLTLIIVGNKGQLRKWFWISGLLTINASVAFSAGFLEAIFRKKSIFNVTPKSMINRSVLSRTTLVLLILFWILNMLSGAYISMHLSYNNSFLINLVCLILALWTLFNCTNAFSILVFYNAKMTNNSNRQQDVFNPLLKQPNK
jgi:hypothetical protein